MDKPYLVKDATKIKPVRCPLSLACRRWIPMMNFLWNEHLKLRDNMEMVEV